MLQNLEAKIGSGWGDEEHEAEAVTVVASFGGNLRFQKGNCFLSVFFRRGWKETGSRAVR